MLNIYFALLSYFEISLTHPYFTGNCLHTKPFPLLQTPPGNRCSTSTIVPHLPPLPATTYAATLRLFSTVLNGILTKKWKTNKIRAKTLTKWMKTKDKKHREASLFWVKWNPSLLCSVFVMNLRWLRWALMGRITLEIINVHWKKAVKNYSLSQFMWWCLIEHRIFLKFMV